MLGEVRRCHNDWGRGCNGHIFCIPVFDADAGLCEFSMAWDVEIPDISMRMMFSLGFVCYM